VGVDPQRGRMSAGAVRRLWDSGVDPVTLELCRLRIATLIGSESDLAARDPRAGLDETLVDELRSWPTSARFSDAQRAILGFAEQYTLDANEVTDEQAGDLHQFFTAAELTTLTIAIAVFDALARVRVMVTASTGNSVEIAVSFT
jgi:alkylhydroperoxidase family enzyme